jgi:hypothetical protein
MENIVPIADLRSHISQVLEEIRYGVNEQRQKGLLVDMPEEVTFQCQVIFEFQSKEVRKTSITKEERKSNETGKTIENNQSKTDGNESQETVTNGNQSENGTSNSTSDENQSGTKNGTETRSNTGTSDASDTVTATDSASENNIENGSVSQSGQKEGYTGHTQTENTNYNYGADG